MRTLYLCYFGIREPLVQTQVLPYLRQLVGAGIDVSLLTFEPHLKQRWTSDDLAKQQAQLAAENIRWYCRTYHKRPSLPATVYDIAAGARLAARLLRSEDINVMHARSHVPAAMGAIAKWISGGTGRLIFDVRGFMPEEYVDAGVWPAGGHLYRWTKRAERRLLASADAFVVLTDKARHILFPGCSDTDQRGRPVEVIPCCVDLPRFQAADMVSKEEVRRELNLSGRRVIVYVGALGGWYLTDEMARFLAVARQQDEATFAMILTQSQPESITRRLSELGIEEKDYLVSKVAPQDVPRYLKAADIALSFIKPCYSKLSSSPTKIAEYLISGLPIVCNSGVGDLDAIIEADQVGTIVCEFSPAAYLRALHQADALRLDQQTAERCRASARSRFDLEKVGGERYRRLYQRLLREHAVQV